MNSVEPQGWAMKKKRKNQPFLEKVRAHLDAAFNHGVSKYEKVDAREFAK